MRRKRRELFEACGKIGFGDQEVVQNIEPDFLDKFGLALALRLAAAHPGERMQQALLYASWNQTHCSQDFARLLLQLKGITPAPEDEAGAAMLEGLGFHTSYFTRKAAFDELCRRTGMTL